MNKKAANTFSPRGMRKREAMVSELKSLRTRGDARKYAEEVLGMVDRRNFKSK